MALPVPLWPLRSRVVHPNPVSGLSRLQLYESNVTANVNRRQLLHETQTSEYMVQL